MTKSELANQLRSRRQDCRATLWAPYVFQTDDEIILGAMNAWGCCFDLEDGIVLAVDVKTAEEWCWKLEQLNREFRPI